MMSENREVTTSTGEPPTLHTTAVRQDPNDFRQNSGAYGNKTDFGIAEDKSQVALSDRSDGSKKSSSLVPQEADSGYEASPSSVNDACSFSFEGREHSDSVTSVMDDSAATSSCRHENFEPAAFEENRRDPNDETSASQSYFGHLMGDSRPTSLPIPIPLPFGSSGTTPSSAMNFDGGFRQHYYNDRHITRSLTTSIEMLTSSSTSPSPVSRRLSTTSHMPLSWPSFARPFLGPDGILMSWWMGQSSERRVNHARPSRTTFPRSRTSGTDSSKSRRRLIDSDASSISSSDGDGPEEVFDDELPGSEMYPEGMEPVVSSAPTSNGYLPISPSTSASTPSPSPSNNVRRSRSVSVNLPLNRDQEEAARDVGQILRRLSDQFNTQMRFRRRGGHGRRYTMNDIVCFSYRNHNRHFDSRNDRDDDDEDFNSTVVLDRPSQSDRRQPPLR